MLSSHFWAKTTASDAPSQNELFCTREWHSLMTDIATTYQTSTLSHVSTDVNKHLQTAEQTIIREGEQTELRTSSQCCRICLPRRRHGGWLTASAVVTSQELRRLDERASPKGANGNVLNLKQPASLSKPQREKEVREASVVCPDREGHGGDSTSYSLRW